MKSLLSLVLCAALAAPLVVAAQTATVTPAASTASLPGTSSKASASPATNAGDAPTIPATPTLAPAQVPAAVPAGLEFSIIKTSEAQSREMLVYSGGEFGKHVRLQHVAILVRHPKGTFLFDTGLGTEIAKQFAADMPYWARPFFDFGPVTPARTQLLAEQIPPIERIIISHGHWDHVSGLSDFPQAEVWINGAEQEFLRTPHKAAVLPSQISGPVKWVSYEFTGPAIGEFAHSLDLFGDSSAVLVPLPGHTPGSTGLFLKTAGGKEVFFIGDTVWNLDAIEKQAPKFWLASKIADHDGAQTLETVKMLARLQQARPHLQIVPAHDARVHDLQGYFPAFVK